VSPEEARAVLAKARAVLAGKGRNGNGRAAAKERGPPPQTAEEIRSDFKRLGDVLEKAQTQQQQAKGEPSQ